MKKSLLRKSILLLGIVILPASSLLAAVTVDPGFQGTLVITTPEGEINLVEPGDAIPEIQSGSILEVFDGEFRVTLGEGDEIELSCLENDASASGSASVVLSCGESNGMLKVESGSVTLIDPAGEQIDLAAGSTHEIVLTAIEEAPATAEGDQRGRALEAIEDVDSTAIDLQDVVADALDRRPTSSN